MAADHDERRLVLDPHGPADGPFQGVEVVGLLAQVVHVPAVGLEALGGVVAEGQLGGAVDGDVVVVIDVDQAAQPEVPSQRRRLVADAFGEVAVATDHERVVVDQVGAEAFPQVLLGHAEADAVADALAQRPGGDLDPRGVVALGVAGGARPPLAEGLEVLQREVIAGEVQHAVEQHRGVAGGEDEAVPVEPFGVAGVIGHDPRPQDVGEGSEGHRRALVAAVGGLGHVHGQATDGVDGSLFQVFGGHRRRCSGVGGPGSDHPTENHRQPRRSATGCSDGASETGYLDGNHSRTKGFLP